MRTILFFILFFAVIFISCNETASKAMNNENPLLGSWRFVEEQELDSNDVVIHRDTNVDGLLIYAPDGKMNVQLLYTGTRQKIMNDTIMNKDGISSHLGLGSNNWSTEEARTIIDTYDAYFGEYSVDWENHIVTHVMSGNLRPEKKGTVYKRRLQLNNDTLLLTDAKPGQHWRVVWVKNKT